MPPAGRTIHFSDTCFFKIDEPVKSLQRDDSVKSSRCKARKNWGVRRTYGCAAATKLKRNAADGLFTKSSKLFPHERQCKFNCEKEALKQLIATEGTENTEG